MNEMRTGITVHCRIRNEERFIRSAIESILPLADRVMVWDTGSTDKTMEIVSAISDSRIEIVQRPLGGAADLLKYRNDMIENTRTEWFMLVDGDEIYPADVVQKIPQLLQDIPAQVYRLVVHRKHFIESLNFIGGLDNIGRIYRTGQIRWRFFSPEYSGHVGHETPFVPKRPEAPLSDFSGTLPDGIFFYHCHYLQRSSRDSDLSQMRRWRRPPLPVYPYLGPWPESLQASNSAVSRLGPGLLLKCLALNGLGFWRMARQFVLKVEHKLMRREKIPGGIQ